MKLSHVHCLVLLQTMAFLSTATAAVHESEWSDGSKHTLYILAMLPYPDPDPLSPLQPLLTDGPELAPAAYLAIEQINNRSDILGDYQIKLIESDGACDITAKTVASFVSNIFHSNKQIVGIIGPTCSFSSKVVSSLTARDEIALTNVHMATTTELGNRNQYQNAFGIIGASVSDSVHLLFALMERNGWREIGILYEYTPSFLETVSALQQTIKNNSGYEVAFSSYVSETFLPLKEVESSGARVIFMLTGPDIVERFGCLAYKRKLLSPLYQWIYGSSRPYAAATSFYYENERYNCTIKEMGFIVEKSIYVNLDYVRNGVMLSGLTPEEYTDEYYRSVEWYNHEFDKDVTPGYFSEYYGQFLYDTVWSLALALNNSIPELEEKNLSLSEYHYGRKDITEVIREQFYKLDFEGVTGRNKYDIRHGYRWLTTFYNQVSSDTGDTTLATSSFGNMQILNDPNPPLVNPQIKNVHVALPAAVIFMVVAMIALLLTAATHTINTIHRDNMSIKASSPRLNHFAYAGCYLLIAGVVVYTTINTFPFELSTRVYIVLCNLIPLCLSCGFTLVLGTMCVKTWRLYKIFVVSASKLRKVSHRNYLKDPILAVSIIAIFLINAGICAVWTATDPLKEETEQTIEFNPGSEMIPVITRTRACHSKQSLIWITALAGYNAILMLVSVVLAYHTRNIWRDEFKTRNITVLIYLMSLVIVVGFPVFLILEIPDFAVNINIRYSLLCTLLEILVYICIVFLYVRPIAPLVDRWRQSSITSITRK